MGDLRDMLLSGLVAANRRPAEKAKVWKGPLRWSWGHACNGPWAGAEEFGYRSWMEAYANALRHVRRCG